MSAREYSVCDGQTCIGRFVVDEKTGAAKAFDAAGKSLGKFPNYDVARRAVSQAYEDAEARKAAAEAARKRLEEPVGFVYGLPGNVGGAKRR
jgi:hypothetical protein